MHCFLSYQALALLLIKHLPYKGVLIIFGMPLAEGHVKFPKIHSLQVQLDLRRKDATTPTATIEHESECVAIDLDSHPWSQRTGGSLSPSSIPAACSAHTSGATVGPA